MWDVLLQTRVQRVGEELLLIIKAAKNPMIVIGPRTVR